jgi:glycosyltransferase involved in cell wall biosynthesis
MKILFLTADYPNFYSSLSGIFCRDHAFALRSVCSDVIVLAVVPISLKQVWLKRKMKFGLTKEVDGGMITYKYLFPSIPKLWRMNMAILTKIILCLYKIVKVDNYQPDVIQIHEYQAGYGGYKILKRYKIPYFITEHLSIFFNFSLSSSQINFARLVFHNAAACVGVSNSFCNKLSAKFDIRFEYIPNVYNFSKIEYRIQRKKKKVEICTIGNLVKTKNHHMLIKAINKLNNDIDDIELHIGGGGPEFENLKQLAELLGLPEKVVFHGVMEHSDAIDLINSCDLFVLSSGYETFGIVLIEALACGKPVVSTKCGGPESIINSEKVGILVDNNEDALYRGMLKAIKRIQSNFYDPDYLKSYVQTSFSKEVVGRQYVDLYEKTISVKMS